jgi:uncharacterized protein
MTAIEAPAHPAAPQTSRPASDVQSANPEYTPDNNEALVRTSFDRWRSGTGSPYELLAPESIWTIAGSSPLSKAYPNREAFLDEVIGPFNARLATPLVPTVRSIYADGDMVTILFDAAAMTKGGWPYHNTYAWYFQMAEGKVQNVVEFDKSWTRVFPLDAEPLMEGAFLLRQQGCDIVVRVLTTEPDATDPAVATIRPSVSPASRPTMSAAERQQRRRALAKPLCASQALGHGGRATGIITDDSVAEMLTKAKRAKAMAGSAGSPEYKRLLADIAADYEQLASCRATLSDTQRHLAKSRRLLGDLAWMHNGTVQ